MMECFGVSNKVSVDNTSPGVMFAWQPRGNFLATVGRNSLVHVWDRHGEPIEDGDVMLKGQGRVICLEWDFSGETLAILQEGNGVVELWDVTNKTVTSLDSGITDPSFLKWAPDSSLLAVGSLKGHLELNNVAAATKKLVLKKHSKRIRAAVWSSGNKLATTSADKMLIVSDADGKTENVCELMKVAMADLCFQIGSDTNVSVNMSGGTLLLSLMQESSPLELGFQAKYGDIMSHCWMSASEILIGFSQGHLVVCSADMELVGSELFESRVFVEGGLKDISYSPQLKCAACAGDGGVKIVDFSKGFDMVQKPEDVKLQGEGSAAEKCGKTGWSPDGQILTVASTTGSFYNCSWDPEMKVKALILACPAAAEEETSEVFTVSAVVIDS